ncbi:transposase [Lysobacter niastensis]|uniref:Transposase n=1 Tax=Lysobacter niastensis TaxID=380629 RepID=A0ABU1WBU3_9GAMM|nr:transposase [Lysobacter niastensis]MDR7135004.1 transposase [Lysobacter niastensis]
MPIDQATLALNRVETPESIPVQRIDDRRWEDIIRSLPGQLQVRARNRNKVYRDFVEGVLWVVSEDQCWSELPKRFGRWRALYVRFLRWNNLGIWRDVADVIGRDTLMGRSLLQRVDQHTAVVRRRQLRNVRRWMLEG